MSFQRFNLFLIVLCAFTTFSCRSPYYEPIFKVPLDTVKSDIQKIIRTEDISIEGHNTPMDDKFITSLGIQLINPQNVNVLPDSLNVPPDSLKNIQKKVARKIKDRLKNPLQYQEYWLIFIKKDALSEGGYFPREFKATEL